MDEEAMKSEEAVVDLGANCNDARTRKHTQPARLLACLLASNTLYLRLA